MAAVRRFIEWNRRISRRERALVVRVVPGCAADGPVDFRDRVLPSLLRPGQRVLDVGGGKHPAISAATKQELGLYVVGLDLSEDELSRAPPGSYDSTVVGDGATVSIPGEYDLVFSRTVLEHVADPAGAVGNLARALAPGGVMAHVVPCRNAPFAILNRCLGNRMARRLLFAIYPEKRDDSGFAALYRDCTPSGIVRACVRSGLRILEVTPYYNSSYAEFLVPLYTLETLRQALTCRLGLRDLAEGFSVVAQAPAPFAGRA